MSTFKAPEIPLAVVEYLERIYPNRAPSLAELHDPVALAYRSGQVGVAEHLRHLFNLQNNIRKA